MTKSHSENENKPSKKQNITWNRGHKIEMGGQFFRCLSDFGKIRFVSQTYAKWKIVLFLLRGPVIHKMFSPFQTPQSGQTLECTGDTHSINRELCSIQTTMTTRIVIASKRWPYQKRFLWCFPGSWNTTRPRNQLFLHQPPVQLLFQLFPFSDHHPHWLNQRLLLRWRLLECHHLL